MQYYCDNSRHLVCMPYSVDNLHIMAAALDIKRAWYHNGSYAHYDIPKKRIDEIKSKCQVVSSKIILKIVKGELNNGFIV